MRPQFGLLVVCLMSSCCRTTRSAAAARSAADIKKQTKLSVQDTVLHRVDSSFVKNETKKPTLPPVGSTSDSGIRRRLPQRLVHVANTGMPSRRVEQTVQTSDLNGHEACSPRSYRLTLRNGDCARVIHTKVRQSVINLNNSLNLFNLDVLRKMHELRSARKITLVDERRPGDVGSRDFLSLLFVDKNDDQTLPPSLSWKSRCCDKDTVCAVFGEMYMQAMQSLLV